MEGKFSISSPQYGEFNPLTGPVNPFDLTNQLGSSVQSLTPPDFSIEGGNAENENSELSEEEKELQEEKENDEKEEENGEENTEGENSEGAENPEDGSTDPNEENPEEQTIVDEADAELATDISKNVEGGSFTADAAANAQIEKTPPARISRGSDGKITIPPGAVAPAASVTLPEEGQTMDQWQSTVDGEKESVESDELETPATVTSDLEAEGGDLVSEREGIANEYQADLDSKLPEAPELEEEPEAKEDGIRETAEGIIAPHIDKKIPDQAMPALNATPSGIIPRLGDSAEMIAQDEEIAKLEMVIAGQTLGSVMGFDMEALSANQQKLEELEAAQQEQMPTVDGESVPLVAVDQGPPPPLNVPEGMQAEIGDVVANLLQDTQGKATEMIDTVRKKAYPNEMLHKTYPDMGADEVGGFASALEADLRAIAEQAGVSSEELAEKIEEEKEKVAEAETEALADLDGVQADEEGNLETQSLVEQAEIDAVKAAADESALNQMEAAQGENDPEVIKLKAQGIREDISATVGTQKVGYDQALTRRERTLTRSKGQYDNAYRMAAVREKNTITPPDQDAEGTSGPDLETAAVDTWLSAQLRGVASKVAQLKASARTTIESYKSNLQTSGDSAKDAVDAWEEEETGKQKSWWRRLVDSFKSFFAEAKAESQAWQTVNSRESTIALGQNINFLDQARQELGETVSEEAIQNMEGVTEEQKAILLAYYGGGPESGDSIAAVGRGLIVRLTNERSAELTRRFTTELEGKPASEWRKMEAIATAINPGFSAGSIHTELYQAMKGGVFGMGTDEDRIYRALNGLSPFEVMVVKHAYQCEHGASLESHLQGELGGAEEDRAMALLESNSLMADAAALNEAMKGGFLGMGTDEETIMTALRGKSEAERLQLIDYYKEQYGRDLTEDLSDELGGHDMDRADALMEGNTARADAIAIDDAMNGGMFGWGTDEDAIESVYGDIRNDAQSDARKRSGEIQALAASEGWTGEELTARLAEEGLDSEGIERDILSRNAQTEVEFNSEYGANYSPEEGESAMRLAFQDEMSDSDLDLANALADNDRTAADAARLANEFNNSIFYASDSTTNDVLESQYTRAVDQLKTDEWPAIQMQLDRDAEENGWDRYQIAEERRRAEAALEQRARGTSEQFMNDLEQTYDSNYSGIQTSYLDGTRNSGGLRDDLERYTQGYGEDKAMDLLDQGGYLDPIQQIEYATNGAGTDEDDLKAVFAGKTQEEIDAIQAAWALQHPGESLEDRVTGELSGRDEFDTQMLMRGLPEDIHEDMTNMRDKYDFETSNQGVVQNFVRVGSFLALGPGGLLLSDSIYDSSFGGHQAEVMRREMEWLEQNYAIVNNPSASAQDQELADIYFGNSTTNLEANIKVNREQMDSVGNAVASAAAITAAVVVGAVLTALSGGTAAPGVVAAIGSIAGALGTTSAAVIAGASALSGVAASIITKKILLGDAYGDEAIFMDMGIGIVDVGASIATFGVGGRVLQALRASHLADPDGPLAKRFIAMAITEYSEGAISSLPSSFVTQILNDGTFADGDAIQRILRGMATDANTSGLMGAGMGGLSLAKDTVTGTTADASVASTTQDIETGTVRDISPEGPSTTPDARPDMDTQNQASSGNVEKNPQVDNLTTGTDQIPFEQLSPSGQLARNNGYPDAPPGYNWSTTKNGDVYIRRNRVDNHSEIKYDADSGQFRDPSTGRTFDTAAEVEAFNQSRNPETGGTRPPGGIDAEGYRAEAENAIANSKKIEDVEIGNDGVEAIKQHLRQKYFTDGSSSGVWDHNEVMIDRLDKIMSGELEPTIVDKNFYAHEFGESRLMNDYMNNGMSIEEAYATAHATISKEYGIVGDQEVTSFYTPEAIAAQKRQEAFEYGFAERTGTEYNKPNSGGDSTGVSATTNADRPQLPAGYQYRVADDGSMSIVNKGAVDSPDLVMSPDGKTFHIQGNDKMVFSSQAEYDLYTLTTNMHQHNGQPVVMYKNGERPLPADYMTPEAIETHLAQFDDGVSTLTFQGSMDYYNQVGRDDGLFIMSKSDMDALLARTGGDVSKIEIELGIPPGAWSKKISGDGLTAPDRLVRVDHSDPKTVGLRVASGNEAGANDLWIPGGKTLGGVDEAVTNPLKPGEVTVTPINEADMVQDITGSKLGEHYTNLDETARTRLFEEFRSNPQAYHVAKNHPEFLESGLPDMKNLEALKRFMDNGVDAKRLLTSYNNATDKNLWLSLKIGQDELESIAARQLATSTVDPLPWTPEHKAQRWNNYKEGGGKKSFESWSNTYDGNINKANIGNRSVDDYVGRNFDEDDVLTDIVVTEKTFEGDLTVNVRGESITGKRRHDIVDTESKIAYEIKDYKSGKVYLSKDIEKELLMDAEILKSGGMKEIYWVFEGQDPSGPLRKKLAEVGIKIK